MKKLALVISGAVSLGAYEAGVVYELLVILASHNSTAKDDEKIVIDVITGASAGGMNAVILAQKLLFQPSRLTDVYDNDLYLPWVRDVDLTGLLNLESDESSILSALSSDLVETVSRNYLTANYLHGINVQPEDPHPAADKTIQLGLAMSNLNGVDYGLELLSGGTMPYTRFQDQVVIEVDSTNADHDTADFWEPLRNAAVACGAFPIAFRVKDLIRHSSDYQNPAPLNPMPAINHFAYTDGGVFQNEPIALAKTLVDSVDHHLNNNRYYMFVAPGMRASAENSFSAEPGSDYFNYWNTGKALINAIFNQARFRDLEAVEKINSRVDALDKQAAELAILYRDGAVTPAQLDPATGVLLPKLFPPPTDSPAGVVSVALTNARNRLQQQYSIEFKALLAVSVAVANSWIDAVLLLETTASLGTQDTMKVYAITDDKNQIAGSGMDDFGGFFDVKYRQHDYDLGRQSMRDFVGWLNAQSAPGLGPITLPVNMPAISIDRSLDNLKLSDIDKSKRQNLYKRLHDLMVEVGVPGAVRELAYLTYLDGQLKKLLEL